MANGHEDPTLFDPEEDLTEEESQAIQRATDILMDAISDTLSKDPEAARWSEERHAEAVAAQDAEHANCFFAHEGCSLDPKVN